MRWWLIFALISECWCSAAGDQGVLVQVAKVFDLQDIVQAQTEFMLKTHVVTVVHAVVV